MTQLINTKVKALVELGLTNADKVREALINALKESPNRYPPSVIKQTYFSLLNDFYNGSTEYCI
jgi:hypothetical protein